MEAPHTVDLDRGGAEDPRNARFRPTVYPFRFSMGSFGAATRVG